MNETPLNWQDVNAAFADLLEMVPSERAIEIEKLKERDERLAAEMASLFAAHNSADGFLEDKLVRILDSVAPGLTDIRTMIDLQPGERLLHFELLELLGEGSLAKVFLARDLELERLVALKVTLNQSEEARTLAHFSTDGIVQVYSEHLAEIQGRQLRLVCLQFIAGPTLAQLEHELRTSSASGGESLMQFLELEKFSRRQAVFEPAALKWRERLSSLTMAESLVLLGMRLAEILAHAHDSGILHLDIKPANILIDPYARPFLSDFNVSTKTIRLASGDFAGLGGTPYYMSPEQKQLFRPTPVLKGETDSTSSPFLRLDARCDVYALGVVLRDLLRAVNCTDVKLNSILSRATEPEVDRRTPSATVLAEELGAWLRGRLVNKELPQLGCGFRWIATHPLWALVLLTVGSQVIATFINIAYNRLQIVSTLSTEQNNVFMRCVAIYNSVTYLVLLLLAYHATRSVFWPSADFERARQSVLRIPFLLLAMISIGWLPGAWVFPWAIDHFAGPIPTDIYLRFAGSFSLAWLVSTTTTLSVSIFVLAQALYPMYWQGQSDRARIELRHCERLNRSLTFVSALVPMAGVLLAVLISPMDFSSTDYRSFKVLLLAIVGFGLSNLFLIQRLSETSSRAFTALKRSRPFD